jgi:mannosyltransferase
LIVLLAFALRIIRLDFQPLWWDEGYSVFFATRDFWTMIERTAIDIHPPLYYAILQLWLNLFGTSDVALRLLSVVIGTATIPLLYILARKLFTDHRIALVAAFLLAISPFHIYYSQEVRMYGLVTLLGLASIHLCVQLLAMTPGTRASASTAFSFILVTTAALYTQYYAAFILSAEILLILATLSRH